MERQSTNEWIARNPISTEYIETGMILHCPRTDLFVVPVEYRGGGSWDCQVIAGNATYPPSGYRIVIADEELKRGERIAPHDLRVLFDDMHTTDGGGEGEDVEPLTCSACEKPWREGHTCPSHKFRPSGWTLAAKRHCSFILPGGDRCTYMPEAHPAQDNGYIIEP